MPSKIEWTDETWNPVTGCVKVSPGCLNCYAERMSHRLRGRYGYPADNVFRATCHPSRLEQPLHWKKPRMIFVCSMGDLFHDNVPDEFIYDCFSVMVLCRRHTFQVLTKRPTRMLEIVKSIAEAKHHDPVHQAVFDAAMAVWMSPGNAWPRPNIWLGVSAEDQQRADDRIPLLLQTPAAVRFLSLEPLLGPIDLSACVFDRRSEIKEAMRGPMAMNEEQADSVISHPVDWVIVGGETGPGARAMHPDWARSIRDQCQAAGVPFFYKRGELDGRTWHEMPEVAR